MFANVGVDGIHYGFLTDYGSVPSLEEALIVCVSPMDFDRPIRLIARNIREFLSVNLTDGDFFYNYFESEEQYLEERKQRVEEEAEYSYLSKDEIELREKVTRYLNEELQLSIIDNSYCYVRDVGMERQKNVTIQTQDGLGVIAPLADGETHKPFRIQQDVDPDLSTLQEYIKSAPVASQLALFRDIQLHHVLQDEPKLRKMVLAAMLNLNFKDEAKRLEYY